jgi:TetR/AcrR family transcriptional regulator, transcriptional repressor for nem operon
MPWPDDHKEQTRDRIVESAATALRAKGLDGVSIAEIMAEAGLTHGGFYAHFKSKDELIGAALGRASRETIERLSNNRVPDDRRIEAVIDTYLSAGHASHPELGCPLAALGSELVRGSDQIREGVAARVAQRIEWVRQLLPEGEATEENATAMVATMLGGLLLARMVAPDKSGAVLEATRSFIDRAR